MSKAIQLNAPAKDLANLKEALKDESLTSSLVSILPQHVDPERAKKSLLIAVSNTPKLKQCTVASLVKALMTAAELGLDCSGTTGHGYIVPYKDKATFIAGYRGLLDLARRTGKVVKMEAQLVYDHDGFEMEQGLNPRLQHFPALKERGEIVGCYAFAKFKDGDIQMEWMTIEDINKIRDGSAYGGGNTWSQHYGEMARKTVLRRLCKYLPQSPEVEAALALDAEAEQMVDHVAPTRIVPESMDDKLAEIAGGFMDPKDSPAAVADPEPQPEPVAELPGSGDDEEPPF